MKQAISLGPFEWAVLNDHGFVCCTTDGNRTRHHVALWSSKDSAELFARTMARFNRGHRYWVARVELGEVDSEEVAI